MRNRDLLTAAKLTPEDLVANREGKLVPQQRKKLQQIWVNALGICVIACPIALVVTLLLYDTKQLNWLKDPVTLLMGLGAGVIPPIIFVFDSIKIRNDLKSGKVEHVEGQVDRVFVTFLPSMLRVMGNKGITVQGISFRVPTEVYTHIAFGKPYHIYYAPRSRMFLAIERTHSSRSTVDNIGLDQIDPMPE
jgi:hypothetical protein